MSTSPVPSLTSDTSETAAPTRSFTTSTNKTQDFGTSLDAIQGTEADDTGVETLPASSTTVHTTYDESSGGDVTFVEDPNVEFQNLAVHKSSEGSSSASGGNGRSKPESSEVVGHSTLNLRRAASAAGNDEDTSVGRTASRRVTSRYNTVRVANQLVPQLQVYFQLCEQYKTQPHGSIMIALQYRTKVTYLQLDSCFGAADMLPLAHILKYNKTINSLDFRRCEIGNYGAYVLGDVLRANDTIQYINLSDNDIGEHGAVALAKGLEHNKTVQKLLLRGNRIGVAGATALSRVICTTVSLSYLDVCNNSLRVYGVQQLLTALQVRRKARQQWREQERAMVEAIRGPQSSGRGVMHGAADRLIDVIRPEVEIKYNGNFIQHEVYNSIIHGTGLLFSIVGLFPLLKKARSTGDTGHFVGTVLYIIGLTAMYLSTTLRHGLFFLENTSELFNQVDKNAIYALIAGTYTPFVVVNLGHKWWSKLLLLVLWSLAISGMVMTTAFGRKFTRARLILYLLMGWIGIIPLYAGRDCFHPEGMFLLCSGGLIYSLGVFFYLRERLFPSGTQGLWYILVVLASALHFFAVYFHTRRCVEDQGAWHTAEEDSLMDYLLPLENSVKTSHMDISEWGMHVTSGINKLLLSVFHWIYPPR